MNNKLKLAITTLFMFWLFGTVFYYYAEGWTPVDAFYFTSVTLSTIGYGDLHPTKTVSKVFTSFFAIAGVAITLYALSIIGSDYFSRREEELLKDLKETKDGNNSKLNLLRADKHIMQADKHVMGLLKKIDERLKK